MEARINRNIVECKLPTAARQYIATPELIETLWNVNEAASTLFALIMSELIETLWNVNNDTITEPNKLKMN